MSSVNPITGGKGTKEWELPAHFITTDKKGGLTLKVNYTNSEN
jgi:hypothetical protein